MTSSYLASLLTSKYQTRRIALRVSYDGTDFHGWQRQPDQEHTVQGTIERSLLNLLKEEISVDGASRTDAGVHAEDQLIALTLNHPIRLDGLVRALNRRLPQSIAVREPHLVPMDFQPRFANHGKRYRYQIYHGPTRQPLLDRYATWTHYKLDLDSIVDGLDLLRGERDFASFAATDGQHKSTIRDLFYTAARCRVLPQGGQLFELYFGGTGFMKQMVRNLVGTLIEVGRGHWPVTRIPEILAARNRCAAGPTAVARGLCLEEMFWRPTSLPVDEEISS